jgi:frataxin-like iron-binding protein CyaY
MKPFDFQKYLKNNPLLKENVNEAPVDGNEANGNAAKLAQYVWDNYTKITGRPESTRRQEGEFPQAILDLLAQYGVDELEFSDAWEEASSAEVIKKYEAAKEEWLASKGTANVDALIQKYFNMMPRKWKNSQQSDDLYYSLKDKITDTVEKQFFKTLVGAEHIVDDDE